ncbi:MAG: hydantoinase B/oxoprolinase family protein [Bdellovibrionota bacterium]
MSWEFSMARSALLHALFERLAKPASDRDLSFALLQSDGTAIHVRASSPADLASLPQAASICNQYLRLKEGDLAIVNDPASGGTSLASITLVTALALEPGFDMLLALRFRLSESWGEKGLLSEEGVRIPPTPLASKREINRDLLNAIASHPATPVGFAPAVEKYSGLLLEITQRLKTIARDPKTQLSSTSIKSYLNDSRKLIATLLHRLPLGTMNVVRRIPAAKETLKLHLEVTDDKVSFDFKGTDTSERHAITDLTALGACVWTVLALLDENVPVNAAVFEHFQISAPSNTLLNWKGAIGTERGLQTIVPAVCETVVKAFAKLNPLLDVASSAGTSALAQMEFGGVKKLTLHIAPGAGATATGEGSDALPVWGAGPGPMSPGILEAAAPIELTALGTHTGSGGKGKKLGGDGALVSFRLREAGRLSWLLGASSVKHEGHSGGRSGSAASIEIVRAGSTDAEKVDSAEGRLELAIGDEVRLYGAGGGAFGSKDDPKEETSAKS